MWSYALYPLIDLVKHETVKTLKIKLNHCMKCVLVFVAQIDSADKDATVLNAVVRQRMNKEFNKWRWESAL